MPHALFSLDAPRQLSVRTRFWQTVGIAAYAVVVAVACLFAPVELPVIPAFALAHALIGSLVSAVTALLMFSHARATGRRGYLWIAMTFLYMAGLLLIYPFYFPDAVVVDERLLGTTQSATTLYVAWHLALPLGLSVATWLLYADERDHRRPGLRAVQLWAGLLSVVAALLVTWLLVTVLPAGTLPMVVNAAGTKNGFAFALDVVILIASMTFLIVAIYCARTGSMIGRWLAAMALLAVGESLVNITADGRYTLGWYFSRMLWLVAASVLLVSLIWNLAKVDRANTELATVDSLTGADSRLAFLSSVQREIARVRDADEQVAMLWIDLDGFKGINDQLGHQVGDEVLRHVVRRLGTQVRITDRVGRLGGDEFGVLLCDYTSRDEVHKVAQRLLAAVREPIPYQGKMLQVTGAMGIATAPTDATTAEELLQRADLAMYAAKKAGGDDYCDFTPDISAAPVAKAQMRQELAQALRDGDFTVHYQPIYDNAGRQMSGVEALVRWSRNGGVLAAGEFVPFAEENGQIVPIGRAIIQQVATDMPAWLATQDAEFFVTLNVSAKELGDPTLVEDIVAGPLSQYADRVVVEITESLELQEDSVAMANLDRVRTCGMRLAIDDFGSGFSNFTRLEALQPSLVKIDRSLVRRAASESEGGVAFLTAATSVAATLNCDVIAEGVQTEAEAQVVQLLGVRYVQGYRFARPGPLQQWLQPVGD